MTRSSVKDLLLAAAAAIVLIAAGCATPVAPTGGPPDKTPPALVGSVPAPEAVNFSADRIELTFSEKVDHASFERALSFTPEILLTPELKWHGERVEMILRGPLRDSTTYILTLDNQMKDNRGVPLSRPITLAFATGPDIDRGRIVGRVVDPENGEGLASIDVFAFLRSVWEEEGPGADPQYRTHTGEDGGFEFSNLPSRAFLVLAVEDRNRNRLIDSTEAVGMPAWGYQQPDTLAGAPTDQVAQQRPAWFLARRDEQAPTLNQIESISASRTELRFSEPVRLDTLDATGWSVVDTVTMREFDAWGLYRPTDNATHIVLLTDSLPPAGYRIGRAGIVRDTAGNIAEVVGREAFKASTRIDTTRTRFIGFKPEPPLEQAVSELGSSMRPELVLNQFVERSRLETAVSAKGRTGQPLPLRLSSRDGTTWTLDMGLAAGPGDTVTARVTGLTPADTTYTGRFAFLGPDDTGTIMGLVIGSSPVVVEIRATGDWRRQWTTVAEPAIKFRITGLLKGSYRLRAFADRNGDGRWTDGRLETLDLPEPMLWHRDPIEVRRGWESDVDTLRFVTP